MLAIYIDAGNSTSGNPRRGWIIVDKEGNFSDFVDEGYLGYSALREAGYSIPNTAPLEVKPSVYNKLKRSSDGPVTRHPIRRR